MTAGERLTHDLVYLIESYPQLGERIVTSADIWPIACILAEKAEELATIVDKWKQETENAVWQEERQGSKDPQVMERADGWHSRS
jgi:hypothetical protein